MGDETKRTSAESGNALKRALSDGAKAGVDSIRNLGSEIASTLKTAVTLGGALTLGGGVKNALALVSSYRDLAFAIQAGTGAATDWRDIQKDIEGVGDRWKQSNTAVAASFKGLYEDIGDVEYAKAATEEVAKAQTATGASMQALTVVAGQLNEKFAITKEELPQAMAAAIAMGNKGGISIEAMGEKLSIVGASAKQLGLQGEKGFERIGAMLNVADGATGSLKKSIGAVAGLLDTLGATDKVKEVEKTLHVKLAHKGVTDKDAIEKILGHSGGKKEILAKAFSGDQLKLISQFGEVYSKAFNEMQGTVKQKTQAGLDAYHHYLDQAGKITLTAAELEAQAKARLNEPSRNLDAALNRFTKAFERPEVLAAMDKISAAMPKLADKLAEFVGVAVDHPVATGAAIVGGKVASDVGGVIAGGLALAGGKALLGALKGGGAAAAAGEAAATGGAAAAEAAATTMPEWFVGAAEAAQMAAPVAAAGAGTAAAAGGGGLLAGAGAAVAAGGTAAVAGVGLAAAGGVIATIYNLKKLVDETKGQGGIFAAIGEAMTGPSKAVSGADYDREMAFKVKNAPPSLVPPPPVQLKPQEPESKSAGAAGRDAADGLKKTARSANDVSKVLRDLVSGARTAAAALNGIKPPGGAGGNGSRGPVAGLPNVPGSTPTPSNR
jgi:hypothetical protein